MHHCNNNHFTSITQIKNHIRTNIEMPNLNFSRNHQETHKKSVKIREICGTKEEQSRKICVISEICVPFLPATKV